mmetsp:Transcript_83151/g.144500  ORF Transcript_83151/g.144500 Transcript_83151/m.144500 type:complete len:362 (-) Transcript_83151:24-1109(-)
MSAAVRREGSVTLVAALLLVASAHRAVRDDTVHEGLLLLQTSSRVQKLRASREALFTPVVQQAGQKLCQDKHEFNETLLVIHFNKEPIKGVLPFLLERYSQCFQHIVTSAPARAPDSSQHPDIICDDMGWTVQKCYAKAMAKHPGYRDYLIMNDDSPFIPHRWASYDKDLWWNLDCPLQPSDFVLEEPAADQLRDLSDEGFRPGWIHWGSNSAVLGLQGLVSWWKVNSTRSMRKKYMAFMDGPWVPRPCTADFIHVPKRMVPFYLQLAEEMPSIWLELFAPMLSALWRAKGEKEVKIPETEFHWSWCENRTEAESVTSCPQSRGSPDLLRQNSHVALYHPLKLSNATVREAVDKWLLNMSF